MGFLNKFESKVGATFGEGTLQAAPISLKKLLKHAVREMGTQILEIDGVDTAPALFTVLVSSQDDAMMRPLYQDICSTLASQLASHATRKDWALVGKPLVRFMVDPGLRSGKFSVFAENVDAKTLHALRVEEEQFLKGAAQLASAPRASKKRKVQQQYRAEANLVEIPQQHRGMPAATPMPASVPAAAPLADDPSMGAGMDVIPGDFEMSVAPGLQNSDSMPMPLASGSTPLPVQMINASLLKQQNAGQAPSEAPAPQAPRAPRPSFMLIDRASGKTFAAKGTRVIVGREVNSAQIVLRDPNVSRRHAEITYDGKSWHIQDLGSTNGTQVNDVSIDRVSLKSGDLITLGLLNLEFRETEV